tara:strand:+ start:2920 stop:3135 length:216 start_codon:yes stop_codon:yes gene_type:complete
MNSKEFSFEIEKIVKEKRTTYMEAILHYCEENDIDPGTVSSLVSKSLKEKVQVEAIDLRLLNTPKGGILPI